MKGMGSQLRYFHGIQKALRCISEGENFTGSSKPELGGFEQQICVKGKGDFYSLSIWGGKKVRKYAPFGLSTTRCGLRAATAHCRKLQGMSYPSSHCPSWGRTNIFPKQAVLQWSNQQPPTFWSPSWSMQCRGGGHSFLGLCLLPAKSENSSFVEGWRMGANQH